MVCTAVFVGYKKLSDAAVVSGEEGLQEGETEVWYMNQERWNAGGSMGFAFQEMNGTLPDPEYLSKTHILLGKVKEKNPENVFRLMQGEVWSPEGEANKFIGSIGAVHTSMSVGDVIVVDGKVMMVDMSGFREVVKQ